MQIDHTPDFYFLDHLEPVTLQVADQPDVLIPAALGRPADWKEARSITGVVLEGDRIWAWPLLVTPVQPPLGSIILDSDMTQWSILAVVKKGHAGIWEFHCRVTY
jgi:hypothetical protein